MTIQIYLVFAILVLTIALFIWDKIRMDLVALMAAISLTLFGILTPSEVVSGFGSSVVIMIAALFIVGEGLFRTGVAAYAGQWLLKVGGRSEIRLLCVLLPLVALLSAFMSSTGAVAILIPIVLSMCRKAEISASKLLMPLSFASLVGGMLTLIGTPPNIVVSSQMEKAGFSGFGFFDFTPVGLTILIVTMLYIIFVARNMLPSSKLRNPEQPHPHLHEFAKRYGVTDHLHKLKVSPRSSLIHKTVREAGLCGQYEITVFAIKRQGQFTSTLMPVLRETVIESGDMLLAYGRVDDIKLAQAKLGIQLQGFPANQMQTMHQEFGVAEVTLRRGSSLLGKNIHDAGFRDKFGLSVIGVRREGKPILAEFSRKPLKFADNLLLIGGWNKIAQLSEKRDFIVLETPAEMAEVPSHGSKAPFALLIMAAMLVLMVSGLVPTLTAIMLAAFAMVSAGCVTMEEAYKSLNAPSLVLIACMLPMALAMEKTGAALLIVDNLVNTLGHFGPFALAAGLFVFTSVFSQFISNTATTVLVAPIALYAAQLMGLNAEPFMMIVAIAASTAFASPIASPVNTLILEPGGYRFIDFIKVGVPLQVIAMIIALTITPFIFPFS